MSAGTIAVPIASHQRSHWYLQRTAFAGGVAAVTAALAAGLGVAAQRYAARRHQAHPVWAAWAVACARLAAGLPIGHLPALPLIRRGDAVSLPLALPERPGLRLEDLAWPAGELCGLSWSDEALLLTVGAPHLRPVPVDPFLDEAVSTLSWADLQPAEAQDSPGDGLGTGRGGPGAWWPWLLLPVLAARAAYGEAGAPPAGGSDAAATYVAVRGETLRTVAGRLWGMPGAWGTLWEANRDHVRNPGFLEGGTALILPEPPKQAPPLPRSPHVVRPGENLWDVAGRVFGDSWAWPVLWGWNHDTIKDPHWIYPDQALTWPDAGDLHVVARGESLWSIARRHYGHGEDWQQIWRANRGWLARPEGIQPGHRLWLPAAAR